MLILILHPTLHVKYTDAMNQIGESKQNLTLGYNVEIMQKELRKEGMPVFNFLAYSVLTIHCPLSHPHPRGLLSTRTSRQC